MNNKQPYIGITIGPISKAFANVRRTRELWAASFVFSHLMREIILKIGIDGYNDDAFNMDESTTKMLIERRKDDFIVPNIENERLWEKKTGIGFFPDRIIFKSKLGDFEKVQNAVNQALEELAKEFKDCKREDSIFAIKNFFKVFFIEIEIEKTDNPIKALAHHLDVLELQDNPVSNKHEKLIFDFFERVNQNGFAEKHLQNKRFKSLVEISTEGLSKLPNLPKIIEKGDRKNDEKLEFSFIEELRKIAGKQFKTYHKYIAIVKVDGDSFGTYLKGLNHEKLKEFHQKISSWGFETKDIIQKFGGVPIYIGGDDILFFAPVCNELQSSNILSLCNEINALFENKLGKEVTLSFGISISYYKFPLYEALEASEELLSMAKAKVGKNSIAIRVLKHSGNYFESVFPTSKPLYKDNFMSLMAALEEDNLLLSSVAFKLFSHKSVLDSIAKDGVRFSNFIDNYFNESVHNEKGKVSFLNQIKAIIPLIYAENDAETARKEVYSILRIAKFIKGLDYDDK